MQELMLAAALNLYTQQKPTEYEAEGRSQRLANSVTREPSPQATTRDRRPLLPRLAGALGLS